MPLQNAPPLDGKHEDFRVWSERQGVVINGVSPANLPGKGTGMIATKKLQKGDRLIFVPVKALITLDSGFVGDFVKAEGLRVGAAGGKDGEDGGLTVHGTVAAALTRLSTDEERFYKSWEKTWPSREDFAESTPLCWSGGVQDLMPPTTLAYLKHQQTKFERDWADLREYLPGFDKESYMYYWLVVNTRCFYWEYFKLAREMKKRGKKLDRDDCMALCPFADYFNHEDEGCTFNYNVNGCSVICNRTYNIGEEVVVSYGQHSNDYLLVEYGFSLAKNKHDNTKLDSLILPSLTKAQSNLLEENGYLGNYTLDSHEICYRTQTAIRSTLTPARKMQQFLSGEYDGSNEDGNLDSHISDVLTEFRVRIVKGGGKLEKLAGGDGGKAVDGTIKWEDDGKVGGEKMRRRRQIDVLLRRWAQMRSLLDSCEEEMEK